MELETTYAECGTAGSDTLTFTYHANGCPHAKYPWSKGERICGFTDRLASEAQRLRNLARTWCQCGNPSDAGHGNGKFYSCNDCGLLLAVG